MAGMAHWGYAHWNLTFVRNARDRSRMNPALAFGPGMETPAPTRARGFALHSIHFAALHPKD